MNISRRDILRTGLWALWALSTGSRKLVGWIAALWESDWGFWWKDMITSPGSWDETIDLLRMGKQTDQKLENINALKISLRDLIIERRRGMGIMTLQREKEKIQEINKYIDQGMLDKVLKDTDFHDWFSDPWLVDYLEESNLDLSKPFIDEQLRDFDKLLKLSNSELDKEYSARKTKIIQESFQIITNRLVWITNGANGFHLTVRSKITEEVADAVRTILHLTLPAGSYKTMGITGNETRTGVSDWTVLSVTVHSPNGKTLRQPRDNDRVWSVIED